MYVYLYVQCVYFTTLKSSNTLFHLKSHFFADIDILLILCSLSGQRKRPSRPDPIMEMTDM